MTIQHFPQTIQIVCVDGGAHEQPPKYKCFQSKSSFFQLNGKRILDEQDLKCEQACSGQSGNLLCLGIPTEYYVREDIHKQNRGRRYNEAISCCLKRYRFAGVNALLFLRVPLVARGFCARRSGHHEQHCANSGFQEECRQHKGSDVSARDHNSKYST
jgi:hypothetical protein